MTETASRTGYGFAQLAARMQLARWQLRLAVERGLVPPPDGEDGRWSAAAAADLPPRAAHIRSVLGEDPPIGAVKAAERLAVRVGLDVEPADVEVLVVSGELPVTGRYQGRPLYALHDIDALDPDRVTEIGAARKGPCFDTVSAKGAAALLGWTKEVFTRIAGQRDLPIDQLGRYPLADVRALAGDEDLLAAVAAERERLAQEADRREAARTEQTIRHWLRDCTDYLNTPTAAPPDTAELSRALRAHTAARSRLTAAGTAPPT
ncbi:hypothetical protein [Thermomonospora cellulosilytica]|uniref:Uncharacterized protein n=1 Tax=Thermomonospora cellulosilytica TaxID=1411118 RepID=A0A7W3MZL2_9ACTN|nr:hypothetical protein [Thermomonospora cellulosilytica]MBA9004794.1 hypothetical protein [Thermomonospora cellulosilytica]